MKSRWIENEVASMAKSPETPVRTAQTIAAQGLTRRALLSATGALVTFPLLPGCGGGSEQTSSNNEVAGATAKAFGQEISGAIPASTGIWYDRPAEEWLQALPVGNGRLGAMLFGGTLTDKVQFNENTLWGGVNNYDNGAAGEPDSTFDVSTTGFGSYLNFGELLVELGGTVSFRSPSGHTGQPGEEISKSVDGSLDSKWCVQTSSPTVSWQVDLEHATVVSSYSLTSANDVPSRDPLGWTLSGSNDGNNWTELNKISLASPFENRLLTKNFSFNNTNAYTHYRFDFKHDTLVSHFQLAEVKLSGLPLDDIYGPSLSSPSGHGGENNISQYEDISCSIDGNVNTKWCVQTWDKDVIWQFDNYKAAIVNAYSIASANDMPERDPLAWKLFGSIDGLNWITLDSQTPAPKFSSRQQRLDFTFSNTKAYRFYRFVFEHDIKTSHFQLSSVVLNGNGYSSDAQDTLVNYERRLDPYQGIHTTAYRNSGQYYTREAFATRTNDVLVLRYTTDGINKLNGTVDLKSAQSAVTSISGTNRLEFSGRIENNLRYASVVQILTDGSVAADGMKLRFSNCNTLMLVLDAVTDYKPDNQAGWRTGIDPLTVARKRVTDATNTGWSTLRTNHVSDFSNRMARIDANWGSDPTKLVSAMPTNLRLKAYADNRTDTAFEKTMFDYGRYLLFSSSRPDGLPANLQGLWNDSNSPAWASDYHNNINVQMNYWGAEVGDMGDSHMALINFIKNQAESMRIATRRAFGASTPGWTARTSQSPFGGTAWEWNTVASAWYAQHIWEHYAFTQDKAYLRDIAYPLLKEVVQFWQARLKLLPNGTYVSPNGWSPEHGPVEDGVMYDQQIIWDLFQNYQEAAAALETDAVFAEGVRVMQTALAPNKIGRWGQLQEWQTDRDDSQDVHRHTSHLFAVYPGRQITVSRNPQLATAAMVSLKARCSEVDGTTFVADNVIGDSRRSWSWPWRAALFARLGDGYRAGEMLKGLISFNTLDNLFCTHPPFQMDGNFGIAGAIPEMLLQSHEGKIVLLPALPEHWKSTGSFHGLRARGGYRVSCNWSNSQVTSYSIIADRAPSNAPITVRVNGQDVLVTPVKG